MPIIPASGSIIQRYRADQGITLDGSGYVTQWNDISGGGRHLIRRDSGAGGPVIAAPATTAGQAVVDFRRVSSSDRNGIMYTPHYFGNVIPADITIALVAYLDGSASDGNSRGGNDAYWTALGVSDATGTIGGNEMVLAMQWEPLTVAHPNPVLASDGGLLGAYYADYGSPSPWPIYLPDTMHHILASKAATDVYPVAYSDGGASGVNMAAGRYASSTHLNVGGASAYRRYFQGFIGEIVMWNRALTSQERTNWNTYVNQRYVLGYTDGTSIVSSTSGLGVLGTVLGVQSQIAIITGVTATFGVNSVLGSSSSVVNISTGVSCVGALNMVYVASSHPTQLLGPAFITPITKKSKRITGAIQSIRHIVSHNVHRIQHIVSVTHTAHHTLQHRVGLEGFLSELVNVNTTDIPNPYLNPTQFAQDTRYKLVYDPAQQKWIAALEPVTTAVDGGTY